LLPLQNPLIRLFSGLIFYMLLPVGMLLFAWKAAVFPAWGSALGGIAVAVIASHVMLPLIKFSWPQRALASAAAGILAVGVMLGLKQPLHRPFDLFGANLSGEWLVNQDLRNAYLRFANLSGADLRGADMRDADLTTANVSGTGLMDANLSGAYLYQATLSGAVLTFANLRGAELFEANLSGADLRGGDMRDADLNSANLSGADLTAANLTRTKLLSANLSGTGLVNANLSGAELIKANLSGADLSGAKNLTQERLDEACGNSKTKRHYKSDGISSAGQRPIPRLPRPEA
jgi:uncharacterized protein YjbI with pentapeptide repeats